MEIIETAIKDIKIIKPKIFADERGYFCEVFSEQKLTDVIGETKFVQDNESKSSYGVVRGLHYQLAPYAQAKLVRVIKGKVLDIAVDVRKDSPTLGEHVCMELSDENKHIAFIPHGFAHGFVVLSEEVIFNYKCDNYYQPSHERGVRYDDPALNIDWLIDEQQRILSDKDTMLPLLKDAELF